MSKAQPPAGLLICSAIGETCAGTILGGLTGTGNPEIVRQEFVRVL